MVQGKLNWSLNPIPTLHTQIALKIPSTLKTSSAVRKLPKIRVYQDNQFQHFDKKDTIKSFSDLSENYVHQATVVIKQTILLYTII